MAEMNGMDIPSSTQRGPKPTPYNLGGKGTSDGLSANEWRVGGELRDDSTGLSERRMSNYGSGREADDHFNR